MMTRQETNVSDLLIPGLSSQEIAIKPFISFHTVESFRTHLHTKFDVHYAIGINSKSVSGSTRFCRS